MVIEKKVFKLKQHISNEWEINQKDQMISITHEEYLWIDIKNTNFNKKMGNRHEKFVHRKFITTRAKIIWKKLNFT